MPRLSRCRTHILLHTAGSVRGRKCGRRAGMAHHLDSVAAAGTSVGCLGACEWSLTTARYFGVVVVTTCTRETLTGGRISLMQAEAPAGAARVKPLEVPGPNRTRRQR